eukprot:gene4124-14232_t
MSDRQGQGTPLTAFPMMNSIASKDPPQNAAAVDKRSGARRLRLLSEWSRRGFVEVFGPTASDLRDRESRRHANSACLQDQAVGPPQMSSTSTATHGSTDARFSSDAPPCPGQSPPTPQFHFDRTVLLIIDALRSDFFFGDEQGTGGMMPLTARLLDQAVRVHMVDVQPMGPAGMSFTFVADTPTITMSRLKGLLTGKRSNTKRQRESERKQRDGPNTQTRQRRRRWAKAADPRGQAVLGDDTWMQMMPDEDAYCFARPYASFNVNDLHTVDDGLTVLAVAATTSTTSSSCSRHFLSTMLAVADCVGRSCHHLHYQLVMFSPLPIHLAGRS